MNHTLERVAAVAELELGCGESLDDEQVLHVVIEVPDLRRVALLQQLLWAFVSW